MTVVVWKLHGCHNAVQHGHSEIHDNSMERKQILLPPEAITYISGTKGESAINHTESMTHS